MSDLPEEFELELVGADGAAHSASVEVCQKVRVRLEITLNHPRTKKFCLDEIVDREKNQRAIYEQWIRMSTCLHPFSCGSYTMKTAFEHCLSGDLHVHMDVEMEVPSPHYIAGVVSQVAKAFLCYLPKRWDRFSLLNYHPRFHRYRCPAVTVQYKRIEDELRALQWETYMSKEKL